MYTRSWASVEYAFTTLRLCDELRTTVGDSQRNNTSFMEHGPLYVCDAFVTLCFCHDVPSTMGVPNPIRVAQRFSLEPRATVGDALTT